MQWKECQLQHYMVFNLEKINSSGGKNKGSSYESNYINKKVLCSTVLIEYKPKIIIRRINLLFI